MEKQTALHIVQTLAQGIDPHSGEIFLADSPYQHPDTVRALFEAAHALTGSPTPRARAASQQSAPNNAGKPWTADEDHVLAERFDAGRTLPELASEHGRTRAAIQARLVKLGKIEAPPELPRFSRLAAQAAASAPAVSASSTATPAL